MLVHHHGCCATTTHSRASAEAVARLTSPGPDHSRHQPPAQPSAASQPPRAIGTAYAPPSRRQGGAASSPTTESRQARASREREKGPATADAAQALPGNILQWRREEKDMKRTLLWRLGFSPRFAHGSDRERDRKFQTGIRASTANLGQRTYAPRITRTNLVRLKKAN
jgi:hypothetical protein